MVKHRFRPHRSVSFPPGIISAAITSRKSVIAVCTPWTDVSRSSLMSVIITFMFEPAKLQMNCASASGTSILRKAGDGRPPATGAVASATAELAVELAIEVHRRGDQRQVGEGLREVADLVPGGIDLLGVQAEVVPVGEHLRERLPRLLEAARS